MTKIIDDIRRMIEDALNSSEWTSANPTHTNRIKKVTFSEEPDFGEALDELFSTSEKGKETDDTKETVDRYKESGVDAVSRYTKSQVADLTSFVQNPFGFITGVFSRALVRGVGVAALVIAIGKLVETIITELTKEGRPLDVRFREVAEDEILKFMDAREQAEIRSGISKNIIVTTIGGLRGDAARGNIGGNYWTPDRVPADRIDPMKIVKETTPATIGLGNSLTGKKRSFRGPGT